MRLCIPNTKYKKSFLSALNEFHKENRLLKHSINKLKDDFDKYIIKLEKQSKGVDLPKGYVPATTYWIIDENEFVGIISIRHRLTDELKKFGGHIGYEIRPSKRRQGYGKKALKSALKRAKVMGIKEVLITCDDNNIGSIKIIKASGGRLKDKIQNKGKKVLTRRYWIRTKKY